MGHTDGDDGSREALAAGAASAEGEILTARLRLVPVTAASLRAERAAPRALGDAIGVEVPASWPPEYYDADALDFAGELLARFGPAWGQYYVVERAAERGARPLVAGVGGYKGAPNARGVVEIGYSVVPERRRRGYAREAVDAWLARAFADPRVTRVIAHTLPHLAASIGVLRSAGFARALDGADPAEPGAIQYVLTRERYEPSDRPPANR